MADLARLIKEPCSWCHVPRWGVTAERLLSGRDTQRLTFQKQSLSPIEIMLVVFLL